MRIISIRYVGCRQTYSPEMAATQHNYLTANSAAVHRNSHAVSYCLTAFKCLWLKAHFAPEYWAAVLNGCHPDRLPRYMSAARSEQWRPTAVTETGRRYSGGLVFGTLNINNLTVEFGVDGNTITQGLVGVKGIGDKAAAVFAGKGDYRSIEEFVAAPGRRKKTVLERLIKLGAFRHLPGHENTKALWMWYQYEHCSGKGVTALRREIDTRLLEYDGWDDSAIMVEIERQIAEFRKAYPKRKIPAKISKWRPRPEASRMRVMAMFPEDFGVDELLQFEKQYLGYYLRSPLEVYEVGSYVDIAGAKAAAQSGEEFRLAAIVVGQYFGTTKNGSAYVRLTVSDGRQNTAVMIWDNDLRNQDKNNLRIGAGVSLAVDFDEARNSFSVLRGTRIEKLITKGNRNG